MRFVYVAVETVGGAPNATLTGSFLQAGFCSIDLSSCSRPTQWRTPLTAAPFTYFFQPNTSSVWRPAQGHRAGR